MADNENQEESETEFTNENFVQLRNAHKEATKELKELRSFRENVEPQLRSYALKEAGFDPESGPAKALLKLHEGELSPDALKQTASEYGLAPGEGQQPTPELTPEQQQAIASTERAQQLAAVGSPAQPPQTTEGRLQAAEDKAKETGDWSEWDRLQVEATLSR